MKVEQLVCDHCGKVVDGVELPVSLPKGWYLVGHHAEKYVAYDDWRADYHFCSGECMNKGIFIVRKPNDK